jgi:DnaK suppressor protein
MTPAERRRLGRRLEALRAQLQKAGPAKIEPNRKDSTATGVADEDEQALSEMLQVLASSQNRKQSDAIARIDRALRRLADDPDSFGLCEECEEEIPVKRLEVMPYATLCTECQAARDPRRGGTRRSLTDYEK